MPAPNDVPPLSDSGPPIAGSAPYGAQRVPRFVRTASTLEYPPATRLSIAADPASPDTGSNQTASLDADTPAEHNRPATQEPGMPHITGYKILSRLGRDGQGEVFRALDQSLGCEVALKIPRIDGPRSASTLRREARALARVRHPNVVNVYSCAECDGQIYFSMELIHGRDAAKLIKAVRAAGGQHSDRTALLDALGLSADALCPDAECALADPQPYYRMVALWIAQAAEGLAAALARGILHRDIKPANLMLAGDGRMIVVDFGLARSLERPSTNTLGVTGTFPYVAPERIAGDFANVDHRADIWALGATLYELLALTRAYERTGEQVLSDIATRDPEPLRTHCPAVPAELVRICEHAMQRDPGRRYQNWRDLARDLRAWLGGELRPKRNLTLPVVLTSLALMIAAIAWSFDWRSSPAPGDIAIAESQPAPVGGAASQPTELVAGASPPGPAPDHDEPESGGETHAPCPETGTPVILLVCNQDLNTRDDDRMLAAGYVSQGDLLTDYLERNGFEVRTSAQAPQMWTIELATQEARASGATAIVLLTYLATPGTPFNVSYSQQPIYPWAVRLHVDIVRICDGLTRSCAADIQASAAARGVDRVVGRRRVVERRAEETAEIALESYDAAGLYYGTVADDQQLVAKAREKTLTEVQRMFPRSTEVQPRDP